MRSYWKVKARTAVLSGIQVGLLLSLLGCRGTHYMRRQLVAYSELTERTQIVGRLGYPLGTYLVVRGSWEMEKQMPKPAHGPWSFRVTHINGNPIQGDIRFNRIENEADGEVVERAAGTTWELQGFETGGYEGLPAEVVQEMFKVMPPFQYPREFVFETRFVYFRSRALDNP